MFAAWGTWVARFRWPVLAVALVAVAGAGIWGMGVFGQLSEGGYNDPGSESTRAATVVRTALGSQGGDVVVIYTPLTATIDNVVLSQRVELSLNALPKRDVTGWASYWQARATQYAAADRTSAVAVLTLAGKDDGAKLAAYRDIRDRLGVEGARTQVAGASALADASAGRSTEDLGFAEAISLPIVLILLLFIFGSLVAAALPVLVGGFAVLGSFGVLHAIALHHDVNSFAVNVASLLGLGMAIDYGLFLVGRFREEQGFGRPPADAVRRTVATAGRTVLFSATLLIIALAGLLLFPQGFLKSLAYGGLASVGLAALLSLTLLPAMLAVLGPRVDKLPVRLPQRGNAAPAGTGWARLSDLVLRRALLVALPIIAGLLVLAAPVRGVHFGETDERVLPVGDPARVAVETLKHQFPALSSVGIQVVLRGSGGKAPDQATTQAMIGAVEKVPGIKGAGPVGAGKDVVMLIATLENQDAFSASARDAVRGIRALPPPPGVEVLVGGATARNVDSLDATANRLPLMIGLLIGATLLLMFLAFGSVLLPIKAVVMSALSLSATFGILVWIFEDGHGADLLNITPAPAEAGIVVLMAAVVFGLSTDYEVFLLSRMVEARTRGASSAEAVATGLTRTGRVITAAAVLLIVVTGAFALSSVTTMRFVGVGMIVALLLDATVVRMLLVPAVLGLLGDAAWWAPGPLRRLQERAGLAEYAGEELFPTISVGRHAAPETPAVMPGSSAAPRHASGPEEPSQSPGGPPAVVPGAAPAMVPGAAPSPVPDAAPVPGVLVVSGAEGASSSPRMPGKPASVHAPPAAAATDLNAAGAAAPQDGLPDELPTAALPAAEPGTSDQATGAPATGDSSDGESAQGESAQGEPAQGESTAGGPVGSESVAGDTTAGDTTAGGSGQPASGQPAPAQPAPAQPAPAQPAPAQPARGEPISGGSVSGRSAGSEFTRGGSARAARGDGAKAASPSSRPRSAPTSRDSTARDTSPPEGPPGDESSGLGLEPGGRDAPAGAGDPGAHTGTTATAAPTEAAGSTTGSTTGPVAGRPPAGVRRASNDTAPQRDRTLADTQTSSAAGRRPAAEPAARNGSASAGDSDAAEQSAATAGPHVPGTGAPGGSVRSGIDDLHGPTIDLGSHLEDSAGPEWDVSSHTGDAAAAEEAGPDTTAILELRPTVDLSARLDPSPEDSPRHR